MTKRNTGIGWLAVMIAAAAWGMGRAPKGTDMSPRQPTPSVPLKSIAFVAATGVDTTLVESCRGWAETNSAIVIGTAEPVAAGGDDLEVIGRAAAAERLKPGGAGLVVFAWPDKELKMHGLRLSDRPVIVLNVRAMRADKPDEERFMRRMQRQSMRALGFLLDLEQCPNPQNAMAAYVSLADLDRLGRNFDPPWLDRAQQTARTWDLPLNTNSPYFLPP